jgi:hypothetical protein
MLAVPPAPARVYLSLEILAFDLSAKISQWSDEIKA